MIRSELTQYGFRYGALTVERAFHVAADGRVCICVKTDTGQHLDIYCSPTGRSLRVFKNGRELR